MTTTTRTPRADTLGTFGAAYARTLAIELDAEIRLDWGLLHDYRRRALADPSTAEWGRLAERVAAELRAYLGLRRRAIRWHLPTCPICGGPSGSRYGPEHLGCIHEEQMRADLCGRAA